jgi:hypothetical protein
MGKSANPSLIASVVGKAQGQVAVSITTVKVYVEHRIDNYMVFTGTLC